MKPALECTSGKVYCAETEDGEIWVSLNGEQWLPVSSEPQSGDYPAVVDLFDDDVVLDDDGRRIATVWVKFARRWLFIAYKTPPRFWEVDC